MMQELKDDQLLHSADEAQFTSRRIGTDISLNELPDYVHAHRIFSPWSYIF